MFVIEATEKVSKINLQLTRSRIGLETLGTDGFFKKETGDIYESMCMT